MAAIYRHDPARQPKNVCCCLTRSAAVRCTAVVYHLFLLAASPDPGWFDTKRVPVLVLALVAALIVVVTTYGRRRLDPSRMRRIPGLAAVEEAIGRATEMARPVLYTPGWGGDIQRPTTIASMSILSAVAHKTAAYDCPLLYPTHDPVIQSVAQETIREAYADEGQLDRFRPENVQYVSSSQFGYAAAVEGLVTRHQPAAVFLLGTFEAESLILAETGNAAGAIQVAGTDSTIQLAFFIVACDYTLIGEELFAAAGYLSGNHAVLASVQAQDYMKLLIALAIIVGVISATIDPANSWWRLP